MRTIILLIIALLVDELLFGTSGDAPVGLIFLAILLYFLPSLVADCRRHPSAAAILALNLFLGWTALGWVGALVWSLAGASRAHIKKCPYCAEEIQVGAKVCKFCGRDVPLSYISEFLRWPHKKQAKP